MIGGWRPSRGALSVIGAALLFLAVFGILVMRVRDEANERWSEVEAAIEVAEIGKWGTMRTVERGAPLPGGGFSTFQHRYRNWFFTVHDLGDGEDADEVRVDGVEIEINGKPAGFRQSASVRLKLEQRRAWLFTETSAEVGVLKGELDGRLVEEALALFARVGLEAEVVDEREAP